MILIGTPTGDTLYAHTAACIKIMREGTPHSFMIGGYVEKNQNNLVMKAKALKASHLMLIDCDMIFPPSTLRRLLDRGKDITGAVYRTRQPPHVMLGHHLDGAQCSSADVGCKEVSYIPSGVMLVNMRVFEKIAYPWFFNTYGEAPEEFTGNDVNFCRKAREHGFHIYADFYLSREVEHIAAKPIGWSL